MPDTPTVTAAVAVPDDASAIALLLDEDLAVPDGIQVESDDFRALGFEGRAGQTARLARDGKLYIAVGTGPRDEANTVRRAAAIATRAASNNETLAIIEAGESQAVGEGVVLGAYRFSKHKSAASGRKLRSVVVVGADAASLVDGVRLGEATNVARDLINEPPASMTPDDLANAAISIGAASGLTIEVWDEARIEEERLGGLLGVARGSDKPPRFIKLTYEPEAATQSSKTIALCGKGITFDTGGLSLKPSDSMLEMKTDMAGAAVVLCAMSLLAHFEPNVRVLGYLVAAENVPGPNAIKPSDVLRSRNGKTMEVLNTDAEGRLVLADALALAVEDKPDFIVDIATLTGAVKIALGNDIAGLYTNDDELLRRVQRAADVTSEPVWRLPLVDKYRKLIESQVADIKNMASPGGGGANTAALFLQEFVADIPWAHLDIANTARSEGDDAYFTKGATGYGVRLLVELIRGLDPSG